MLPTGHIAAGYLTAEVLLKFAHPNLAPQEINQLVLWCMFFSFAPDLDMFLAFAKEKALIIDDVENNNHRRFLTHAPILWLIAGLLVYIFAQSPFYKIFGLLVWLGSWSHFLLDSIEYGVMWLWPFTNKRYCLKQVSDYQIKEKNFFSYWIAFLKLYSKSLTFYCEILIIVSALIVFFK